MSTAEAPVPVTESRARIPLTYVKPDTVPNVSKKIYTKNGKAPNELQKQITGQVANLGAENILGLTSMEGLGWTEVYRQKGKKIGESSFEVVSDVITAEPGWDNKFRLTGPSLVMSSGHKALVPRSRRSKKVRTPDDSQSMLTIAEYTYARRTPESELEKILLDKKTVPRDEFFEQVSGHFSKVVSSMWYKKPEGEHSDGEPDKLNFRFSYGPDEPGLYTQLEAFKSAYSLEDTAAVVVWKQGDLTMRATTEVAEAAYSFAGTFGKKIFTVQTIKDGKVISEKVYDDIASDDKNSEYYRGGRLSFSSYINGLANDADKPNDTHFEIRMTPEQKEYRKKTAGDRWLGGVASADVIKPIKSDREAIGILTYIPMSERGNRRAEWKRLWNTRKETPKPVIQAVKDISAQIGKKGLTDMAAALDGRYRELADLLYLPVPKSESDDATWAINSLAEERARHTDKDYREKSKRTTRTADPIPNSPESNAKRAEVLDLKLGEDFYKYVGKEGSAWGKTIDEKTLEETHIKHVSRHLQDYLALRLNPSQREQLIKLVESAATKEFAKTGEALPFDKELIAMGRILRRSVGR